MKHAINVTRSSMPLFEEYCAQIRDLWDSRWLTNSGIKHRQLEAELKAYLGAQNISLFANGHLALEYAIAALKLPKGGEVITTPFTFASTTHAIVRSGLIPVFCDINAQDYTIDAAKIEALITEKTCVILPVHVYGNICDTAAIANIAQQYGLKVIYDAAHAFGVRYKGESAANFGDIAMFSFHATKVFHTIEGGGLCFQDPGLQASLDGLKNFGITGVDEYSLAGGNAKMNEFQAAMGICNLRYIDENIQKRRTIVERYIQNLQGKPGLKLWKKQADVTSNYAYFPVVFDGYRYTRDEVLEKLAQENIQARRYFYPLTSSFSCYDGLFPIQDTPVARHISENVLCLPLYPDMSLEDADRVCKALC